MPLARLIGLACAKSGGDAIRIIGVIVVDVAVAVDINEVSGVTAVRRAEPPVNGAAGCDLNQSGIDAAYLARSLRLIFEI